MKAMVLETPGRPLVERDLPRPRIGPGQVLLRVRACAVCRTDLHILDGELPEARLPLVPGHQIVGTVAGRGPGVSRLSLGDRVGVPWLGWTCNRCGYCRSSRENLCDRARSGYHRDGGYAEYAAADERYCFPIPPNYSSLPLFDPLGRACGALGRQSHPARWRRISRVGDSGHHRNSRQSLCSERRQPGPVGAAVGNDSGHGRSGGRLT